MLNKYLIICLLSALLIFSGLNARADGPGTGKTWQGLEHLMSREEFRAAGLDKLSPEELQQLDQWLLEFLAYDSQQVVQESETIQKLQKTPVTRHILGHFDGWSGKTVFRLDNGEVWRQRLPGKYSISLENPEVQIKRNLLGYYELRIVKTGRKIGVTRVK